MVRPHPKLDILSVAGTNIVQDAPAPVSILWPAESPTNQIIRVQARNFTTNVPITVAVIPENGPPARFQGTINLASGTPPFVDVNVTIPLNTVCNIQVWSP